MLRLSFILVLGLLTTRLHAVDVEDHLAASLGDEVASLRFYGQQSDQGSVAQGQEIVFQFPYSVEGQGSVKILGVHQECGCLTQSIQAGQVLRAGEKGILTIRADTSHFTGRFDKRVTLLTNEDDVKPLSFRLKAEIEGTLSIKPPLVELNFAEGKIPKTATVILQKTSKQRLHIEKVTYNEDTFDVAYAPIQDAWELKITWKGEAPKSPRFETIEVTTDSSVKRIKIPVVGSSDQTSP